MRPNSVPLDLLKKHYSIQSDTLDEIAELIALSDCSGDTTKELIEKIDNVAAAARKFSLLNPYSVEAACAWVESLEYTEPRCDLPPVVISETSQG